MTYSGGRRRAGTAARWLAGCLVACLVGVFVWLALAGSSGALASVGASGLSGDPLQNASLDLHSASLEPLVASGGRSATEEAREAPEAQRASQRAAAARQARLGSPAAIAARAASRTKFAHLGAARAAQVAREAFPEVIDHPVGGPPHLPAGQRIVDYVSSHAAQLALPGGKHAVVESLQPMAVETSRGHRAPVDLGLTKVGGDYESVRPVVGVLIPQRLSAGVELPEAGVSLTPVDAQGRPLGGAEGAVDGASVLYANTQIDMDTAVKPTTGGVEVDTILRSVNSPEQLYFRVGLPPGAKLVQAGGAGPVKVMNDGQTTALVRPPSAVDAAGTDVPVSMSVSGDLLALGVSAKTGSYQWPIAVDPELESVTDKSGPDDNSEPGAQCHKQGEPERKSSNWCWHAVKEENFEHYYGEMGYQYQHAITAGEYTVMSYHTQGESHIYKIEAESSGNVFKGRAKLELARSRTAEEGEVEHEVELVANGNWNATGSAKTTLCANSECSVSGGSAGNIVAFKLEADESFPSETDYALGGAVWGTYVYVAQEKGPELSFNESEPTIDGGRANVLYGTKQPGGTQQWLGPNSGAFEVKAHDPGIGVSWAQMRIGLWEPKEYIYKEGKCNGVQCNENYSTLATYNPEMSEGEDTLTWYAEDLAGDDSWPEGELSGLLSETSTGVKVDAKPPGDIEVSGWPARREISAARHTLTVSATDEAPDEETHSSGVKSISVSVDGGAETSVPGASCSLGTCTGSGKYTLDAEGLTEGVHRLVVTATDNADNVGSKEFTFDVRHGSPVPVGPGTVDPTTGQFKLSTTDVSLAGSGGVSRVYESRNVTAGAGGPLGPQWALSLGGGEGLTVLPTGSVVLASSAGATTTFTRNEKGEFESPLGDGNVKIEAKEKEAGEGITEYLLKENTAGTTTTFTQPTGAELTAPVYSNQFGAEGAQLHYPESDAVDSSGNVWVTDFQDNRVEKFSPAGVLLDSYSAYGSEAGQLLRPWGIAINHSTGNVYVTDQGNNRIVELNSKGEFVKTFGWDVNEGGENKLEVCTSYCKSGTAGSGNGQVNDEAGVAVDSSGNVWVVDYGNDRIEEFNEKGEYEQQFGVKGKGEVQFEQPLNIAFSGGKLYVTDYGNDRVEELSSAGKYEGQFGKEGAGNGEFKGPRGIAVEAKTGNLYVTDGGNSRVQEFNASGNLITKFGSAGSGAGQFSEPTDVAVSSSGVYVTDYNNKRVQEWTRPSWLPERSEGPLKSTTVAYAYKAVEEEGQTVIEPTEQVAPAPAGVTCTRPAEKVVGEALEKGCRALLFFYGANTKAGIGEAPSQWGEYAGHLASVSVKAYNPAKGAEKMEEKTVAGYSYDSQGRLRAEWDPRIEASTACGGTCAPLKTTYGYDAAGHVTALTPPGQQPWAFTYGTIAGDPNTGRLLKVTRAQPKAGASKEEILSKLKEQSELPTNTEAPKLSGVMESGYTMSASTGVWSDAPVVYAYRWKDCNSEGKECTPIAGAINADHTLTESDLGHKVVVEVTATNGAGSVSAESTPSASIIHLGSTEYALSGESGPVDIVTGPDGNLWYTSERNEAIGKITTSGSVVEYPLSKESVPGGITAGPDGNLWYTNGGANKIGKITTSGTITEYALPSGSSPGAITVGPDGNLWYTEGDDKIGKMSTSGAVLAEYDLPTGGNAYRITAGPEGYLWYVEWGSSEVGKISTSGAITQYALPVAESYPNSITAGPEGNLWYTDDYEKNGAIGKITPSGTITEYALPAISDPVDITQGPEGNLWYTDRASNKIGQITPSGTITEYPMSSESDLTDITLGPDGNVWFTDYYPGKIGKVMLDPAEGEQGPAQPGTTIEYRVPVSGAGAPYQLSSSETARWGQKEDLPAEAMAIFPPAKPMGWPAKEYERATVNYMDEEGRTVNTASPSGGITTTEYNEINEVTRTLSADNRATALAANEKSVEVADNLETKNIYNEKNQLAETVGSEHEVKIAKGNEKVKSGSEVKAREHVKYFYDEGSPEGKTYNLVTKTVDSAETASKEEFDPRTATTSYSGAGSCEGHEVSGWTLRRPTSTTKEPGGLNLTMTTVYEPCTGNVVETKSPGASQARVSMTSQFGSKGSGVDELKEPNGLAVDTKGDVWVADHGNQRVDEFNPKGEFVEAIGFGVVNGKEEYEVCSSSCQIGLAGSGKGEIEKPEGVAFSGGDLYVTEDGNARVQEFNEKSEEVTVFGEKGTAGGDLKEPDGIAVGSGGNVWVVDHGNNRVEEFSSTGVFRETIGFGVANGKGEYEVCTSGCRAGVAGSGKGQFSKPQGIAVYNGDLYVTDSKNNRVEEFSESGGYIGEFGGTGSGGGQFEEPAGIAAGPAGTLYVVDEGNDRVEAFSPGGEYKYQYEFGTKGTGSGELKAPEGVVVNTAGDTYVADKGNNRVEEWQATSHEVGNEGAHDSRTVYYSSGEESAIAACRKHPEWANLPCQTEPAEQTGVSGSPAAPVTKLTYNIWDEVEKTEEEVTWINSEGKEEKVTRTKAQTYDPAGRALTSEEKAEPAADAALPGVTNEYNETTGALEKQSALIGGKTRTITSVDNTLGELEKYTDAEGNTSTYVYNLEGQVEEINDGQAERKGVQNYTYAPSTGYLEKLVDSSAGAFTATYDAEGKILTENYPNGMTAKYTYNPLGTAIGIEYKKESDCATKCPETWFSDTDVPSIHGETLQQTSTLSKENYTYDEAGRLTETQEVPAGKRCRSRLYGYNEESDRTSQTTRESSTETCATEGGTVQTHFYDTADHLIDTGVKYETFGNTLTLPEADAEGHELTSTYYVDNQVLSQTQNGTTNEYVYDPAGRTMEMKSEVKSTKVKTISIAHYSGPGGALTWMSEEEGKKWSRNIPGIDGALDAIEKSGEETKPVLEIHDLQGNIVGEAADSEVETKLLKTYNSTEFGVPNEGKAPPKYAWLGAGGVASETAFGTGMSTRGGASYVPQIARNLQTAPVVPPGAFPNGQGTGSQDDSEIPGWYISLSSAESAETLAAWTAKQKSERGVVEVGEDPPFQKWFGQSGQVTAELVVDELVACYGDSAYFDSHVMAVAECVVSNTHFYFADVAFETYGGTHAEKEIVEHYGVNTIIQWGNEVTADLAVCVASMGEYTSGRLMCEVEVHEREDWIWPGPPEDAEEVGEAEAGELKHEGEEVAPAITFGINYFIPPAVSLCTDGESQCSRIG